MVGQNKWRGYVVKKIKLLLTKYKAEKGNPA